MATSRVTWNRVWLPVAIIGIAITTVVIYLPGMQAGFLLDDDSNIVLVPALHWSAWSIDGLYRVFNESFSRRRFVANLSFALNHLVGGLHPVGYHWTNLGIHLAVGASLLWVAFLISAADIRDTTSRRWALIASVLMTTLYLWHPLNVQAVTYVVQRMATLATLFSLLSLGLYISARNRQRWSRRAWLFTGSGLCWILALGSKETALALPGVALLHEASVHRRLWRQYAARLRRGGYPVWCAALALFAAVLVIYGLAQIYYIPKAFTWSDVLPGYEYSGYQRVLTQARVQFFYLGLLLWPDPSRLNLDHDFAYSVSLVEPWTTLAAITAWGLGLLAAAWLFVRKPRYGFPVMTYLLWHVIESGPIKLELVYEHRMYLPMTALVILGTNLLTDITSSWRVPVAIVVASVAIPLAAATYYRNEVWGDPVAFLYDCATKSPRKFRPQYNLGTELGQRGHYLEAEKALRRALQIRPQDSQAHNQLANVLRLTGRRDQALEHYRAAVQGDPKNPAAIYNLARELELRNRICEAVALYARFVHVSPPWLAQVQRHVVARLAFDLKAKAKQCSEH